MKRDRKIWSHVGRGRARRFFPTRVRLKGEKWRLLQEDGDEVVEHEHRYNSLKAIEHDWSLILCDQQEDDEGVYCLVIPISEHHGWAPRWTE